MGWPRTDMGQVTSQDAVALSQAQANLASVTQKQHIHIDLGTERATCTLQASLLFPPSQSVRAWRLWTGDDTSATFMDSRIDAPECIREAYIVRQDGVFLMVPPSRSQKDAILLSLTLYLQTPLVHHAPKAPCSMQCPVLRCKQNTFSCELYAYEGHEIEVMANPPLASQAWTPSTTNAEQQQLTATFSETDVLGIKWMPMFGRGTNTLRSKSAYVTYHANASIVHRWSDALGAHMPWAVFDMDVHVSLSQAYVETMTREARLDLSVDMHGDTSAHWDTLSVDGGPSIARQMSTGLSLWVDVHLACGSYGAPAAVPLQFVLHGRMSLALQDRSNAPRLTLPSLRLPTDQITSEYVLRHAPWSEGTAAYALDVLEPMQAAHDLQRVGRAPARIAADTLTVRWRPTNESHSEVLTPRKVAPTLVQHTVWPGASEACHRVFVHTRELVPGAHTLCLLPCEPSSIQVVRGGQKFVRTYTVRRAPQAPFDRVYEVRLGVDEPLDLVDVQLDFVSRRLDFERPLFAGGVASYLLQVGTKPSYTARFHVSDALVAYDDTNSARWTHIPPSTPCRIRVTLMHRDARPLPYVPVALGMLCAVAACLATIWAYGAHATARQLSMRIDALAMALDVDFTDGQWLASADAPYTPVPGVASSWRLPWFPLA